MHGPQHQTHSQKTVTVDSSDVKPNGATRHELELNRDPLRVLPPLFNGRLLAVRRVGHPLYLHIRQHLARGKITIHISRRRVRASDGKCK